jgi:hypothetical protein
MKVSDEERRNKNRKSNTDVYEIEVEMCGMKERIEWREIAF